MVRELPCKHGERRAQEHHRTIRVPARPTARDLLRPAMQARKVLRVRSALADSPDRVSQRTQAEEARAALSRALGGQVTHDPGGLAYAAGGFIKEADHAAAER